jgi:hypothetical protein
MTATCVSEFSLSKFKAYSTIGLTEIELTGHAKSSNYLSVGHPALLTAVATDEFEIAGLREDRLHIDRDAHGAIIGITINPGLCPVRATRK